MSEDSGKLHSGSSTGSPDALEDWLALYALNALDPDDRAMVERRLAGDAHARALLEQMRESVDRLASDASAATPAARTRERVLARIDADLVSSGMLRKETSDQSRLKALLRTLAPLAAIIALLAACGLGVLVVSLQQQLAQSQLQAALLESPQLRVSALPNAAAAPANARVTFLHAPGESTGVLTVQGLQTLGPEQTYEFWLLRGGQPVSAGRFAVDNTGAGRLLVRAQGPIGSYDQAGLTIEPAGGSPTPTLAALVSLGGLN
jgi:anti-sigma-K factor RskA